MENKQEIIMVRNAIISDLQYYMSCAAFQNLVCRK